MERETNDAYYTYSGKGGVPVGNLFQRLVFATSYGEMNFLFSSGINGESKIMYNRDPRTRVEKAAPFLTTDTKPYPAVVDGRIVWIVDAYTTAENYPYAQAVGFGQATTNSLVGARHDPGQQADLLHPQLGEGHGRRVRRQRHALPGGRPGSRCSRPGRACSPD